MSNTPREGHNTTVLGMIIEHTTNFVLVAAFCINPTYFALGSIISSSNNNGRSDSMYPF